MRRHEERSYRRREARVARRLAASPAWLRLAVLGVAAACGDGFTAADPEPDAAVAPDGTVSSDDGGAADGDVGELLNGYAALGMTPAGVCAIRLDGTLACHYEGGSVSTAPRLPPRDGAFVDIAPPCAIRSAGDLVCWGSSSAGDPAAGAPPDLMRLAGVGTSTSPCALRRDGTAACWSSDPSWTGRAPPGRFVDLSAATSMACAVRADDAALVCWEPLCGGTLGCPAELATETPIAGRFASVRVRDQYSGCAIAEDGSIACWGETSTPPPGGAHTRLEVFDPLSAGWCAIREDESIVCWGSSGRDLIAPVGRFVDLGIGTLTPPEGSTPTSVAWALDVGSRIVPFEGAPGASLIAQWPPPFGQPFTAATALEMNDLCLRRVGGDWVCRSTYMPERVAAARWIDLVKTARGTCGIREDGGIECWDLAYAAAPPGGVFRDLAGRRDYFCALGDDGAIACFGDSAVEGLLAPPPGVFTQLALAGDHACAIDETGAVACWGNPPREPPPGTGYRAVAVSAGHGCAIRSDGHAQCWSNLSAALPPAPAGPFAAIVAGGGRSEPFECALREEDAAVVCWGSEPLSIPPEVAAERVARVEACGRDEHLCIVTDAGDFIALRMSGTTSPGAIVSWLVGR